MISLPITFLATCVASILLTAGVRAAAIRFRLFDYPDGKRKLHQGAIPVGGGIAVYIAMVLGIVMARQGVFGVGESLDELSWTVLSAAGFVCLFGCIDDLCHLSARWKLLLQISSVLPIVLAGHRVERVLAFGLTTELGWLSTPLTIFWLVGCINAINLLDGMDGLASIVGISTAIMMGVIATCTGNQHVAVIAIVLAAALAGFLFHNLPPARIFLGDSGSMVIGLIVGLLGIQSTLKTSATLSITAPLVVMSFPMFDTVLAIMRRKLTGRRFDDADHQHIHHRLLDRGMNPWVVLGILGALCLTTGVGATVATILHSDWLAWVTAGTLIVLVVRFRLFGNYELTLLTQATLDKLGQIGRRFGMTASVARPHGHLPDTIAATEPAPQRKAA